MHRKVKEDSKDVKRISLNRDEGFNIASSENDKKINFILAICFCAGVVSGMLGVGGGIIMAPLMLELGIEPQITTSTSNFLLMFTSSAATVLFILSGQLVFKIAMMYGLLCGAASTVGSSYINEYITKTKRASILIWILFYVMASSLVILPLNGIRHAIYDISKGLDVLGFRRFC